MKSLFQPIIDLLAGISMGVSLLLIKVTQIMGTLQDMKDALASIASGVDGLESMIKDLKTQVAAGSPVSQADLDALIEQARTIGADISDTSDTEPDPTA